MRGFHRLKPAGCGKRRRSRARRLDHLCGLDGGRGEFIERGLLFAGRHHQLLDALDRPARDLLAVVATQLHHLLRCRAAADVWPVSPRRTTLMSLPLPTTPQIAGPPTRAVRRRIAGQIVIAIG